MEIPASLKINSDIFEKKGIYYFSSELLNTTEPHYFIIVEIDGKIFHMVVCTTQREKRVQYLKFAKIDICTLVPLKPTENLNELTEECYVDCNTVFSHYTVDDLQQKIDDGVLEFKGNATDSEYWQILNGIINSPRVDLSVIEVIKKTFEEFNS